MAKLKQQQPQLTLLEQIALLRPSKAVLAGVRLVQPINQGDYDGLCGLYSILNGIRLVLAPHRILTDKESRALFRVGIRYIDQEASLSRAVQRSIGKGTWPGLAERLRARAQEMVGIPLVFEQPLSAVTLMTPGDSMIAIEEMILDRKAALVFMRGKFRHYSLISGYTPVSLRLFDSYGYHWVRRASCGSAENPVSLHRFHMETLITAAAYPRRVALRWHDLGDRGTGLHMRTCDDCRYSSPAEADT